MTGSSNDALQVFYGAIPLAGAILLAQRKEGNWADDLKTALNKRIDDFSARMDDLSTGFNARLNDLSATMTLGFQNVNARLDKVEERLTDLERARLVR